jgi:catechol 2,3-dioxygenase-like lactoylglutathione lyase family enzyme
MLQKLEIHATLPVQDMVRAQKFYEDKLGFTQAEVVPGAVIYRCKDSWFVLFQSTGSPTGQFTQAGWQTDDIEAAVADLKSRGVVFEEYDFPNFKTVNSVVTTPANRAAWFKDSEGNLLGLVQF